MRRATIVGAAITLALMGCDGSSRSLTGAGGNPVQTGFPGDPAAPGFATPAPIASTLRFTDLDLGRSAACAVATTGDVYCWGTTGSNRPVRAEQVGGFTSVRVAADAQCGTRAAPGLWCWGIDPAGDLGTLGAPDADGRIAAPTIVPGTDSLASYSLGEDGTGLFACGRTTSGRALCWGSDRFGQLGVDGVDPSGSPIPAEVAGDRRYRDVRAGFRSACAVDLAGGAWCWGENGAGRLGDGTLATRRSPGAVLTTLQFASVSTGESMHACALTDGGAAHCWGANDFGQLGVGTHSASTIPITVRSSPPFSSIVAGTDHSCGLTPSGEAWCWGRNDAGQLGGAANLTVPAPTRVVTTVRFKKLSLGHRTSCGVAMDDTIWCWGSNDGGLLGRGL